MSADGVRQAGQRWLATMGLDDESIALRAELERRTTEIRRYLEARAGERPAWWRWLARRRWQRRRDDAAETAPGLATEELRAWLDREAEAAIAVRHGQRRVQLRSEPGESARHLAERAAAALDLQYADHFSITRSDEPYAYDVGVCGGTLTIQQGARRVEIHVAPGESAQSVCERAAAALNLQPGDQFALVQRDNDTIEVTMREASVPDPMTALTRVR